MQYARGTTGVSSHRRIRASLRPGTCRRSGRKSRSSMLSTLWADSWAGHLIMAMLKIGGLMAMFDDKRSFSGGQWWLSDDQLRIIDDSWCFFDGCIMVYDRFRPCDGWCFAISFQLPLSATSWITVGWGCLQEQTSGCRDARMNGISDRFSFIEVMYHQLWGFPSWLWSC